MTHVDFIYLQNLRQWWSHTGHSDVPKVNCSCGFNGEGGPKLCALHEIDIPLPWDHEDEMLAKAG